MIKDFDNIDYLSRILNNQIVPVRNVIDTRQDRDKSLREKYYSVTLGDMMKQDTNLLSLLSNQHLYTFSPPAFGLTKRPGDNFTPWQCVLAEEAPPLATTVYRQAVDKEDFDYLIDESGKLHESKGVTSIRRYSPKSNPPTALGYLKESINQLVEDSKLNNNRFVNYNNNLFISPIHQNLIEERLKRLKLEEKMLLQAEKLDMLERIRKPVSRWYTIKTPQFFYEARKHNQLLRKSS
ncbi:unnamed protein product [Trichobilharzia szidati]|nr:unnamed protein product [Trichobilharzia szidati]CAH8864517.1 unnamed protein product [Trichobilharzia szidati]CAH8864519.1 unnamed protein product [Trichobilharzia szidati]